MHVYSRATVTLGWLAGLMQGTRLGTFDYLRTHAEGSLGRKLAWYEVALAGTTHLELHAPVFG